MPKRNQSAAIDIAIAERQLVRIGHIDLPALLDSGDRSVSSHAVDASALNGHREKHVGVVQIVVIEKVFGARQKSIRIDSVQPRKGIVTPYWCSSSRSPCNGIKPSCCMFDVSRSWPGNRDQRRRLVKVPVKSRGIPN